MAFKATFLLLSMAQNNIIISMIKRLYLIFYTFGKQLQRDNVAAYASSMAFFFLLSIIPILLIGCVILSYLPFTEDMVVAVLEEYTPGFIDNVIESSGIYAVSGYFAYSNSCNDMVQRKRNVGNDDGAQYGK